MYLSSRLGINALSTCALLRKSYPTGSFSFKTASAIYMKFTASYKSYSDKKYCFYDLRLNIEYSIDMLVSQGQKNVPSAVKLTHPKNRVFKFMLRVEQEKNSYTYPVLYRRYSIVFYSIYTWYFYQANRLLSTEPIKYGWISITSIYDRCTPEYTNNYAHLVQ